MRSSSGPPVLRVRPSRSRAFPERVSLSQTPSGLTKIGGGQSSARRRRRRPGASSCGSAPARGPNTNDLLPPKGPAVERIVSTPPEDPVRRRRNLPSPKAFLKEARLCGGSRSPIRPRLCSNRRPVSCPPSAGVVVSQNRSARPVDVRRPAAPAGRMANRPATGVRQEEFADLGPFPLEHQVVSLRPRRRATAERRSPCCVRPAAPAGSSPPATTRGAGPSPRSRSPRERGESPARAGSRPGAAGLSSAGCTRRVQRRTVRAPSVEPVSTQRRYAL